MSERPTPETDAVATFRPNDTGYDDWTPAEFARRLERERDEAIRQRDETNRSSKYACDYNYEQKLKAERERDEARLMSQPLKFATIVLTIVVVAISSILFLAATQRDDLKKQAVERGFAEWFVDPNGQTTWQWKEAK